MKITQRSRVLMVCLSIVLLIGMIPFSVAAVDISAPADGNFSFLWVSDPQIYTNEYPDILSAQNDWILENANRLNVKYAIHTGDLVHVYNDTSQWDFVSNEYKKWDDAGFAYGVLAGNHDMSDTDYSLYSQYFGKARYESNWWYGGDYSDNYGHYDLRSTGGADFIFVYLSYGNHTQADYDWVNSVLQQHSDRIAILAVHEYMASSEGRSERGDVIFEEVVLKNPNVRMVLCGHNYNSNRTVDEIDDDGDGKADRTVYQIMANYQYTTNGGNGFIRFMECDVANGTITHRTYSPYIASFGSDYEDWTILDEYGYRDEFVTPFDFSNPVAKAEGDPEIGTVVYSSQMSFAPTATEDAVTLDVAYQNTVENGSIYAGVGVYDRFFSLDASDAFTHPSAVNYVVTEYAQSTGYTVTKVIEGASLGSTCVKVPIPHNGAVVVLPADAPISLDTITVGRRVMLNKLKQITTPVAIRSTSITVPLWGGIYSLNDINRVAGNGEWILYDSLSSENYGHTQDMLFSFSPVSGSVYSLTTSDTTLGMSKSLSVPSGGFVLAVNTCGATKEFLSSMRTLFQNGLQVTLGGHTPGVAPTYDTTSLLAPAVGDWKCDSTMVVEQSGGAQVFYNTDSLYPDATYTYSYPIKIDPSSTALHYDYMLATDARTSIVLFLEGSSGEQSITIQSYFDGVTLSTKSGDAKGDNIRREGKIDINTMDIPTDCYASDGMLTLTGIRVFASGAANTKLNIYTLTVTTDLRAVGEVVIPQNLPLLRDSVVVADASKAGGYTYDNGTLTVVSDEDNGYALSIPLNSTFDVSSMKNWLVDIDATVPFDIQLTVTTSKDDAQYGLSSDFWPSFCNVKVNDCIPAGDYTAALDLNSCYTYNNVLPANGITTIKAVTITLAGKGSLVIDALQVSNVTQVGTFADGIVKTVTTPQFILGDVTGDTLITTSDARYAILHAIGGVQLEGDLFLAADFNKDGKVTTIDAQQIIRYALKH